MSNLSEFITDINETDHTGINVFGAAIGTVADFSSGIGLIVDASQLLNMITSPDHTAELLQDIRNELRQGFAKLGLQLKGDEILREWDNLDAITRDAEGIYLTLNATVNSHVGGDEVVRQIATCATAINGLSFTVHGEQWLVSHADQVYFSLPGDASDVVYKPGGASSAVFTFIPGSADATNTPQLSDAFSCQGMTFTSTFDPGGDDKDHVFSYTYTLPAYMKLVMIFLATAATLDPDYTKPEKYADVIRLAAKDLAALELKIRSGIVNVAAPDADSMIIPFPFNRLEFPGVDIGYNDQRASGRYNNTWWFFGWGSGSLITDLSMPYGAVNLYSGFHSIKGYPVLDIPVGVFPQASSTDTAPPAPTSDFFIRPVSKYLVRSLARSKDVYVGIGLRIVWGVINRLNSLVGDPPPPPCFGDWSLREIFGVLGFPRNPFFKAPLTIGQLAMYLAGSTPFFPVPPRPFSLRQLIDGLPPSAPFVE